MKTTISLVPSHKAHTANRTSTWLASDNRIVSSLMEESVSNRQTLLILHACLAFAVLISTAVISPMAALVLLLWFAWAVLLCKKGGNK